MQELPHHYAVSVRSAQEGPVTLSGPGLNDIDTAAPAQFGGPGNLWSPEDLLVGSVANCFILSFRAIARASRFEWVGLTCDVEGKLERIDRITRFTHFTVRPVLTTAAGVDPDKAHALLEKAEKNCLITNSLSATTRMEARVEIAPGA
jgi:organic hydroperoxide reductase OsmC/OhrA